MVALKIAWQFIKKNKIQSIVIFLTVVIGVGVQFFVFSLGNVLSSMILEQATMHQEHLVIKQEDNEEQTFAEIDYEFREALLNEFSEISKAVYTGKILGTITLDSGTHIPFNLYVSEAVSENANYLDFYGVSESTNIVEGRANNPLAKEIMLDDYFAKQTNIKVGDVLNFKSGTIVESFTVVGTFDLGIYKMTRSYAYISHSALTNEPAITEVLNLQLVNPTLIEEVEILLKEYIGEGYTIETWVARFPEMQLLDAAQKAVVLVIQVLISVAIFAIILSILSFMIRQKEKQVGILKAIGLENKNVFLIFAFMSVIISFFAGIIGLVGGTITMYAYHDAMRYPNGLHRFAFKLVFSDYIFSSILAILAVVLATLIAIKKNRKSLVVDLIK